MRVALHTGWMTVIASTQFLDETLVWRIAADAASGVRTGIRAWAASWLAAPLAQASARATTPGNAGGRLTPASQWLKLSGVLSAAGERARTASVLQETATRQLDLAQYGLITLRDELSVVMTMPSRRDAAVVQMFSAVHVPSSERALAA